MNWYFGNLLYGFKVAFFIPSSQRIKGSWHSLIAIALTACLLQFLFECAIESPGAELRYVWYNYHLAMFVIFLFAAYLICCVQLYYEPLNNEERVLEISTAFYNSYFFLFIPYALLQIYEPSWYEDDALGIIDLGIIIWAFLVMFRIAAECLQPEILRLILSGFIAAGAMYLLNSEVYLNRMAYKAEAEQEGAPSEWQLLSSEALFGMQPYLLQRDMTNLKASRPGQVDIYALSLGSYGYQDVFMREARYVTERLKSVLGIGNTVTLINNEATFKDTALANSTNLRSYLDGIKEGLMQPEEDIVLIYLTSHGDPAIGLAVNLDRRFSQINISPQMLAQILKDSGIKNKIIIISACYSGVFIPHLQDENTMIMTASSADRPSYGCSDYADLTYFAKAFFKEGLSETTDLEKAFHIASERISKREKDEDLEVASQPQIFIGDKIKSVMRQYKAVPIASTSKTNDE